MPLLYHSHHLYLVVLANYHGKLILPCGVPGMHDQRLLYLSRRDVEHTGVTMSQVIAALEQMFVCKGRGEVEMPPKPGIHTRPDAFIHAMPAYIPALRSAGIKWVSGYPQNYKQNLPYISGLIILNDDETGLPYCVMDCTWITAIRTGAATAVAAGCFARPDSSTVGIIACGVQGRANLEAIASKFKIEKVHAYDAAPDKARQYAAQCSDKLGIHVEAVDSPRQAVRDMDIVVTSGPILKNPHQVIEDEWFARGAFASPVDFDSYWQPQALCNADVFATDDIEQLFYYQGEGFFKKIPPRRRVIDLGDVAAGKAPRRENDEQRIICVNLGLALDDIATAPLVYQAAMDKALGTWLEL